MGSASPKVFPPFLGNSWQSLYGHHSIGQQCHCHLMPEHFH